jgi:hypothetical protein
MSFRSRLFLYRSDQVTTMSTYYENNCCIVEQGVQLLQGQPLESTMVKHKLEARSTSGAKRMKFKIKDKNVEIQPTLFDQIHFPTCMYITI